MRPASFRKACTPRPKQKEGLIGNPNEAPNPMHHSKCTVCGHEKHLAIRSVLPAYRRLRAKKPPPSLSRPPEIDQLTGPAYARVQESWSRLANSEPSLELWRDWTFATHANGLLESALEAHFGLEQFDTTLGDQFRKAVVLERLGRNEEAVAILRSLSDPTGTSQRRLAKILLDQGELELAYEAANAALQVNQGDLSHLTVWCEVQLQRGELEALRKKLAPQLLRIAPQAGCIRSTPEPQKCWVTLHLRTPPPPPNGWSTCQTSIWIHCCPGSEPAKVMWSG